MSSGGYFTVSNNDNSVWPIWNAESSAEPKLVDTEGRSLRDIPASQPDQEVDIPMSDADGDGIADEEEDVDQAGAVGGAGSDLEPEMEPEPEQEPEPEPEPMEAEREMPAKAMSSLRLEKIAAMKKDLHDVKMARHFANSGTRAPSASATPMLGSISRVKSAPRMNDSITFRNEHGETLYKKARSQLQPYALVSFADALGSGVVTPRDLVVASFNLAACMRSDLPFRNKIFNFHPNKQTVRARSITTAASQLGQAFQHAVLPVQMPFLAIGPVITKNDGNDEIRNFDKKTPVDQATQDEIIDPKNDVEKGVIRGLVDKDQFGQDNIPSLRNIRGEQAVLWEQQAKATIRWGVGFYRGSSAMQRDATTLLDQVAMDTTALLKRAKLFEGTTKISEPKALEVLIDRNRLSWDQARALLAGRRAIVTENVAPLYSEARRTQDIEASSGYFNKDNDRNKADKLDSEEIIKLLAELLGSDEVARFWWTQYSKAEIVMWKILAAEGESANFERAMRQYIYLAYQIGFMIDGRTRIFLQAHCDTYDEVLYEYDGDLEPDKCCPPKPKCKPKCVTRYVYCEPAPCVEIVEPPCVDVVCVPHCVEPAPCPERCEPAKVDPCSGWHEVLVPEPEHCGPPCQNEPDECMKKSCAALFGIGSYKFLLKAACDEDAKPKVNKWLQDICRQIECFVEVYQQPRSADKRVAEAASVAAAIIKRFDNSGTRDELHMFSTALKQLMWILFKTLWCSGMCRARLLMIEIASYMYTLSKRPTAAGAEIVASKENLSIVGAFASYLKDGPRSKEMSQKFQLIEEDAPFMLPDTVRNPEALFHTLRGMLDAVQDQTVYHKTTELDEVEVNFIYGEWDYVYKRMVDKLGADFKPETKVFTGEEKPPAPKMSQRKAVAPTPTIPAAPAAPAPTPAAPAAPAPTPATPTVPAPAAVLPSPLQQTPNTPPTPATPTLPPPPAVTPAAPAAATTTPMIKTTKISAKGSRTSDDDDDEASDEFESSPAVKKLTLQEILDAYD